MRRLSGVDADLLYAETPNAHLHVGALLILDPSTSATPFGVESWRMLIESHLEELVPLRQRLAEVPFGIDRPYWVDDPHFDLGRHVRRIAVPAPGGSKELGALVGDLCSYKLDRTAPLWEMWFIEGVENGRIAVLFKAHHCAMDGMTGALMLGHLLTPEPVEPRLDGPRWQPAPGQTIPSPFERFAAGLRHVAATPWEARTPLRDTVRSIRKLVDTARAPASAATPLPFSAPRTRLNRDITPHRAFAYVELPLDPVKQVKRHFDVKVNDVAVAICAGALREFLRARGELPKDPLIAAIPVSIRTGEQMSGFGNAVSGLFATLATHLDDPAARLRAIHEGTVAAKRVYESGIEDAVMEWADVSLPGTITLAGKLWTWMHLSERLPPIFNLLISNVPGPPMALYAGGARLVSCFPMGPLVGNVALNVTIMSYGDALGFGLLGCPEVIPDLWEIAERLSAALDELTAATLPAAASPCPAGRPPRRPRTRRSRRG